MNADLPRELTVVSLFSGAFGLDLGFEKEGFKVCVAYDINKDAINTIKANRPSLPVIQKDLRRVSPDEILRVAELSKGEATVVTGGPPCQAFSTAGRRLSIKDRRTNRGGDLVFRFIDTVEDLNPRYFVFENVTGLVSAAIRHVSFYERVRKKKHKLRSEERLGSAFEKLIDRFKETGYFFSYGILNAADYGVAQKRKRLFVVGSREGGPVLPPPRTHLEDPENPQKEPKPWTLWGISRKIQVTPETVREPKRWVNLRDCLDGLHDPDPEYTPFPSWGKYLRYVPEGGCWIHLPKRLQKEAMGGAFDDGSGERASNRGGRRGFFRRLSWDKPAPTLVTSPVMKATCLCHPSYLRPLSVREYARVQGFPDDWKFVGSIKTKYRLIGEAVPIPLAQAVASAIKKHFRSLSF